MNKKPELLIITSTHGDERIGLEVVRELFLNGLGERFDFIVANPYGLVENKRFINCDLNRAYPGKSNSEFIEEMLAKKNIEIAKQYKYIIDLHEARCGTDDFVIIPRPILSADFPLNYIDLKTVLLWPEPRGPMGGYLNNLVELEFGTLNQNRSEVIRIATGTCQKFIAASMSGIEVDRRDKEVYEVYGSLSAKDFPDYMNANLKDFENVNIFGEVFYPLLVNQYIDIGIVCYKMKKK